tara:strand:+ start:418 stop:612 length:195 start_codon:yes stop_codon:yes gene_type:complete
MKKKKSRTTSSLFWGVEFAAIMVGKGVGLAMLGAAMVTGAVPAGIYMAIQELRTSKIDENVSND